jgi:hypothetical protein
MGQWAIQGIYRSHQLYIHLELEIGTRLVVVLAPMLTRPALASILPLMYVAQALLARVQVPTYAMTRSK